MAAEGKQWTDLSERTRRLIIAGAAIDGILTAVALIDATVPAVRRGLSPWAHVVSSGEGLLTHPTTGSATGNIR